MKLSKAEKILRKDFKEMLAHMGGAMGSCADNQFSVVVVPAKAFDALEFDDQEKNKFFYVASSYCSSWPYNRKLGELVVLERLFDERQFMVVPALNRSADDVLTDMMEFLGEG